MRGCLYCGTGHITMVHSTPAHFVAVFATPNSGGAVPTNTPSSDFSLPSRSERAFASAKYCRALAVSIAGVCAAMRAVQAIAPMQTSWEARTSNALFFIFRLRFEEHAASSPLAEWALSVAAKEQPA